MKKIFMHNKKKKLKWKIILLISLLFSIYVIIGFGQTKLEVTEYIYQSEKIPEKFDNYKIVLISDLHHKNFGRHQSKLIRTIKNANPDLILLTGDIVDGNHTDMTGIEDFLQGISSIAPGYYVSGNHETDRRARKQYDELKYLFAKYGVVDLDNASTEIKRGESSIYLHGQKYCAGFVEELLKHADEEKFNILMYHCSNSFDSIYDFGYDIIMSGHTHGGIVRLPFVGGLISNSRSLFPKYDGGKFVKGTCTLISSRGLGDADIPRFYNPPEVVVVTLKCR